MRTSSRMDPPGGTAGRKDPATRRRSGVEASSRTATPGDRLTRLREKLLEGLPVSERRLEPAGIPTAVVEGGEGPPIVLLHGPGEFAPKWLRVIPDLVRSHRVIAPDLPGHGASGPPRRPLDPGGVLAWLEALIESTCSSPPTLVGHVLGGAIAARFAARHEHLLERLVLVDSLGLAPFRPSPRFALTMLHFMVRPRGSTYDRFMRQCSYDLDLLQRELGDRWPTFEAYQLALVRIPHAKKAVRTLMRKVGVPVIPPEELSRIDVPTALIWGRHDRANPTRVAEEAASRQGWPLHVIEDCADDPPRDRPQAFLRALEHVQNEAPRKGEVVSWA